MKLIDYLYLVDIVEDSEFFVEYYVSFDLIKE